MTSTIGIFSVQEGLIACCNNIFVGTQWKAYSSVPSGVAFPYAKVASATCSSMPTVIGSKEIQFTLTLFYAGKNNTELYNIIELLNTNLRKHLIIANVAKNIIFGDCLVDEAITLNTPEVWKATYIVTILTPNTK